MSIRKIARGNIKALRRRAATPALHFPHRTSERRKNCRIARESGGGLRADDYAMAIQRRRPCRRWERAENGNLSGRTDYAEKQRDPVRRKRASRAIFCIQVRRARLAVREEKVGNAMAKRATMSRRANDFPELWGDADRMPFAIRTCRCKWRGVISIGWNFPNGRTKMYCRGFMAEVEDRLCFETEAFWCGREDDCRRANAAIRPVPSRNKNSAFARSNKTIVRQGKCSAQFRRRYCRPYASDAPAADSFHSRVNLAKR